MSVAKYLVVLLLCLKGISATPNIEHITLGETELIHVTDNSYAIFFHENSYLWKVVVVNGDDVTTTDLHCMIESHKLNEDTDSKLYKVILTNLKSARDPSYLARLGFEPSQLSVEQIDSEGNVKIIGTNISPDNQIRVVVLDVPFSKLKARTLINQKFIAAVDPVGRLKVHLRHCVPKEQLRELFNWGEGLSTTDLVDQLPFDLYPEFGENPEGEPEEDPEFASYGPYDELRQQLGPNESFRDPDETWQLLEKISRTAHLGNPEKVPESYLSLIDAIMQKLNPDNPDCTPEGLVIMSLEMRNLQRTHISHLESVYFKRQFSNCVKKLEMGISQHVRSINLRDVHYLVNFFKLVRNQYYDDQQISADSENDIVDKMIPTESLYTALASFLRCAVPGLVNSTEDSSPIEPILLSDAVQKYLGQKCESLERATTDDVRFYDQLMAHRMINENSFADMLPENQAIIATNRICKSISQQNLDTERLKNAIKANLSTGLSCPN